MPDDDAEIDPIPADGGFVKPEPELDTLSGILSEFNNIWGTLFTDADRVGNLIANFPQQVEADTAYRNARRNSARENARVELDVALRRAIINSLQCSTELYKHYTENADFKRWLHTQIFAATYAGVAKQ